MKMEQAEAPHALQATLDGQLPDKQMRNSYTRGTNLRAHRKKITTVSVFLCMLKDLATAGDHTLLYI